jgi:mRNA export factor
MALFGSAAAAPASTTTGDTSKDVEVQQSQLPSDSIWDKKVYIYEITASGANGKYLFECQGPVLGVGWSKVSFTA